MGQSSTLIDCPVFISYNFLMQIGPRKMVAASEVKAANIIRVDESEKAVGIFHPKEERNSNNNKSIWKSPS
jgi:hypothetical protein